MSQARTPSTGRRTPPSGRPGPARRTAAVLAATALVSGTLVVTAPDAAAGTALRKISATELPGTATPTDLEVSASGAFALVLTRDGMQRLTLGAKTARITAATAQGFGDRLVIKPAGNTAYVLLGDSRLLVIDLRDGGIRRAGLLYRTDFVSSSAFDLALSADGDYLYVKHGRAPGSWGTGSGIQVLSVTDPLHPRRLADVQRTEYAGDLARAGQRLVTTTAAGTGVRIYPISGDTVQVGRAVTLPFAARAVCAGPSGNYAFAFSSADPLRVAKISVTTGATTVARVSVPDHVRSAVVSADTHWIYATTAASAARRGLVVLSAADLTVSSATHGVHAPPAIAQATTGPGAGLVYVLDSPSADGHPSVLTYKPRTAG